MRTLGFIALIVCWNAVTARSQEPIARQVNTPRVLDDRLELTLFASEPDIVTPVGLTFDHRGRLLVIESHTHFPTDTYPGPKADRIRVFEDTTGDGKADSVSSFLEGTVKTMSLRRGPNRWVYVATRMQIVRVRDADGDGTAEEREVVVTLNTPGDYPHNGLGGLCLGTDDDLYFGFGENLGAAYSLVGSDGTTLSGGGEGGNVYHCKLDGSGLRLVASGFWNPFGMCLDTSGRLFAVGNDPDASPPCRLVHVVEGGDYGYQFRYGRSGKHPLQAWDGELPGTLPMVAGTSEAPSGVVPWHGKLYSSSWGEYRVERFSLRPRGASVTADREVVVQGDEQFRPVDFAISDDDELYFSDWVDRSYNVHGKGRIWRLRWKVTPPQHQIPPLSPDEQRTQPSADIDWDAIASSDPFLHHAAMMALKNSAFLNLPAFQLRSLPADRLAILEAARRSDLGQEDRDNLLRAALTDADDNVRVYAARWIADQDLKHLQPALQGVLNDQALTTTMFQVVVATIDWLETGTVARGQLPGESAYIAALHDDTRPHLQAMALRTLPANHASISIPFLTTLLQESPDQIVRREAARTLAVSTHNDAAEARSKWSQHSSVSQELRDDIASGMPTKATSPPKQQTNRPVANDIASWTALLEGPANAEHGWRVFFGQGSARCANCHQWQGRGAGVGPDLTSVGRRMDRTRLLQSILLPSQEMGPRYVPWTIATKQGRALTAMSLGVNGNQEHFLDTNGTQFDLAQSEIESRQLSTTSIMPDGLHQVLTLQELRDVLALLAQ